MRDYLDFSKLKHTKLDLIGDFCDASVRCNIILVIGLHEVECNAFVLSSSGLMLARPS